MFNEAQSYAEGWLATTCSASSYFPEGWMQIERFDEMGVFADDLSALAYVTARASCGSQYHRDTLEMIEQSNFKLIRYNK